MHLPNFNLQGVQWAQLEGSQYCVHLQPQLPCLQPLLLHQLLYSGFLYQLLCIRLLHQLLQSRHQPHFLRLQPVHMSLQILAPAAPQLTGHLIHKVCAQRTLPTSK